VNKYVLTNLGDRMQHTVHLQARTEVRDYEAGHLDRNTLLQVQTFLAEVKNEVSFV
jgi:hypothetical protein